VHANLTINNATYFTHTLDSYESRCFTLTPDANWNDNYYVPSFHGQRSGTMTGNESRYGACGLFIYNGNNAEIRVVMSTFNLVTPAEFAVPANNFVFRALNPYNG
jgi:hypothetical protein